MKASLESAIWKEEVLRLGLMAGDLKETSKMEKRMDRELLSGPLESATLAVGKVVSSMALEYFIIHKIILKNRESGQMERERSGLMVQSF